MGNLTRKPAQILLNAIDTSTITYSAGNFIRFANYNDISIGDTVLKFSKSETTSGTAQVATVTPAIAYPVSAQSGASIHLTIKGKAKLTHGDAGRADNFYLSGVSFQGYLASLAAENVGYLADADYTLLVTQLKTAINTHPLFKGKILASGTTTLVLTSQDVGFQFEVIMAAEYGAIVATTPGVYPLLTLADVQRLFPITKYKAGTGSENFPDGAVTAWARFYFKIEKDPAYALEGAGHVDKYIEEVEFYLPNAVAEASTGLNWEEKIFDFLTEIGYSDPHGGSTPWGLEQTP